MEYGRRTRALAWVVCLTFLPGAPAFAQQDTWTDVARIVAVGDIHGDYEQAVKALRAAQVVDEKNH